MDNSVLFHQETSTLMWFKNITFLRLMEPLGHNPEALAARLERHAFQPCPSHQPRSAGWTPPLGRKAHDWVHAVGGRPLICLRSEEKVLPGMVINQLLAERLAALEEQQGHMPGRREQRRLRDELVQDLLPRALSRTRLRYAYLDLAAGWLVVDSASRREVEEITAALRQALDSLAVVPPQTVQSVAAVLTGWLAEGQAPDPFRLGDVCELRDGGMDEGVVRCRGQDLTSTEIREHVHAGKQVARLGLIWQERIAFVLDEALIVRRLRFLDVVRESLTDTANPTSEGVFDAEYALMSGELAQLLPDIIAPFGGLA